MSDNFEIPGVPIGDLLLSVKIKNPQPFILRLRVQYFMDDKSTMSPHQFVENSVGGNITAVLNDKNAVFNVTRVIFILQQSEADNPILEVEVYQRTS